MNAFRISTGSRSLIRNAGKTVGRCQNSVQPSLAQRFLPKNSHAVASRTKSSATPTPPPSSNATAQVAPNLKNAKTSAGTGDPEGLGASPTGFSTSGPVTWPALGLVAIAAASAVAYYKIERERRLENAMGKIVSK